VVFSPTYTPPEKMISIDSPPAGGELCEAYGKRKTPQHFGAAA